MCTKLAIFKVVEIPGKGRETTNLDFFFVSLFHHLPQKPLLQSSHFSLELLNFLPTVQRPSIIISQAFDQLVFDSSHLRHIAYHAFRQLAPFQSLLQKFNLSYYARTAQILQTVSLSLVQPIESTSRVAGVRCGRVLRFRIAIRRRGDALRDFGERSRRRF